jgi:hypothetical protein
VPALAKLSRPYPQNKIQTKELGHGSNGKALALYTQGPEFNSQYCKGQKVERKLPQSIQQAAVEVRRLFRMIEQVARLL